MHASTGNGWWNPRPLGSSSIFAPRTQFASSSSDSLHSQLRDLEFLIYPRIRMKRCTFWRFSKGVARGLRRAASLNHDSTG
eukprot:201065-Pleurochrysis_carterae.AAC.1